MEIRKNNQDLEVRYIKEIRADISEGIVRGTAIVFNSESQDLGGFTEVIKPESVTREFLDNQDIVMLYNHNADSGVLARSKNGKGTLNYSIDERGVNFEFKAKSKDSGIVESIAAGDLDACSFAFRVAKGGEKIEKRENGMYLRTISAFEKLADFSIVVNPAYTDTTVNTRKLAEFKELLELDENDAQRQKEIENKKKQEFNKYYQSLIKKYLK
jgi:uncharacterized protein